MPLVLHMRDSQPRITGTVVEVGELPRCGGAEWDGKSNRCGQCVPAVLWFGKITTAELDGCVDRCGDFVVGEPS
jgi:hypothetical protein